MRVLLLTLSMESLIGVLLLYISLTRVLPAYGVVGGPPITTQIKWMSYLNINTGGKDPAICGATLIDRSWLLTAAHCVTVRLREFYWPGI